MNDWFLIQRGDSIIRGRRFIKAHQESGVYPFRVEIFWDIREGNSRVERDMIEKLEENLNFVMERDKDAILVAVYQDKKNYIFTWYVRNINYFGELLNHTLAFFPELPLRIYATEDPEWKEYKKILADS